MTILPEQDMEKYPHMRVLYCRTCDVFEEMPDWVDGPNTDPYLPPIAEGKHAGHLAGGLFRVPIGLWLMEDQKRHIIDQIKGGDGAKGLGVVDESFYDTRNTFQEDAGVCYQKHLRPTGQCPDFRSESKRLKPSTSQDRKDLGLQPLETGPRVYLCDFCVVRMYNERKARGE